MKSTKFVSKLFIILLLVFISCQKDDGISGGGEQQENIPDTFSEYFGNDISRDFLGTVIDKNNLPIEGVTISIGNETALTDSNGVFIIRDANVNERFGYVKAEKTGYIHGSRSVVPSNGTNKVTIMLLEATVVGSVNSGSSGTITINDGSSVSFDGNFIKEDASAYSGSVDVIMHHLDPADEDMSMQMPGMLYAENEDGAERMLQTLGMLAIELRGSGGEDLNLAAGSTSEIKIPVDASLMSIAPATIPLWYFDEANGYWKEEGEAILQGNMYVGNVSHFSFWNCDIPAEAISLCVTVLDQDGNEFSNLNVSITSTNIGTTNDYTNNIGEVCGFVPNNEALTLNIYMSNLCIDSPVYSESIGLFTEDSSIIISIQNNSDITSETITGNLNTCDDISIFDGYVQLNYANQTFIDVVNNGSFELNILSCNDSNTFVIKGIDYLNLQSTGQISYTFTSPLTNIGTLNACNSITEFIEYTIDDGERVFIHENISLYFYSSSPNYNNRARLLIHGHINDQIGVSFDGILSDVPYEGTYDSYDYSDDDTGFRLSFREMITQGNKSIHYNLTNFGAYQEYIDINFSGSFNDVDGNSHQIIGVVHVLRD